MADETELPLRITVLAPPPGVRFALQSGKDALIPPTRASRRALQFDFTVRVGTRPNGRPNFLGPCTQGPPDGRFIYISSGTLAGQAGSCWTRRAKVPLSGITWAQVRALGRSPGARLEARIRGRGDDDGPACGTVPLESGQWQTPETSAV